MSQSQLDLESFAASILLDDLQIMGDDSAGKSGNGSSTLQGGDSSSADQVMQPAQLPQEAGSFCEEAAWAGAQGWGPELTALAAGDFSMQSPFTPNDESGLGQQGALDSPDLQLHRAASVPFMQQLQHFSVEVAACASPGRTSPESHFHVGMPFAWTRACSRQCNFLMSQLSARRARSGAHSQHAGRRELPAQEGAQHRGPAQDTGLRRRDQGIPTQHAARCVCDGVALPSFDA